MPEISFPCPHCGQNLQAPSGSEGHRAECPECKREVTIPSHIDRRPPPPLPPPWSTSPQPVRKTNQPDRIPWEGKVVMGFLLLWLVGYLLDVPFFSGSQEKLPPKTAVTVKDFDWYVSGFSTVMMVNVTISNPTDYAVKDVRIECTYSGKSGTRLGQNVQTIYDVVPARCTKTFRDVNMGFINPQASAANAKVTDLKFVR